MVCLLTVRYENVRRWFSAKYFVVYILSQSLLLLTLAFGFSFSTIDNPIVMRISICSLKKGDDQHLQVFPLLKDHLMHDQYQHHLSA